MRRYYITAQIGDGGEMHATAYPADICHDDDKDEQTAHTFSAWIETPFADSGYALVQGAMLASKYFNRLFLEEAVRAAESHMNSNLYRHPPTKGEW